MDPFAMLFDDTCCDDDIIRIIETTYPDHDAKKEYLNMRVSGADTFLMHSICHKHRQKLVGYLLRNGADPNAPTRSGIRTLDVWIHDTPDNARIMALLAYGADPNMDAGAYSILALHIFGQRINISNILMAHGAQLRPGELETLKRCGRVHFTISD